MSECPTIGRIASYADVHALLESGGRRLSEHYSVQDQLTLSWGFLPQDTQPDGFPASHAAWDQLNRDLPHLLANSDLLEVLEKFPTLDASAASLPDEFLSRASCFLGYAVHAAFATYQSLQPVQAIVTASTFVTPACLERPWRQVMERLRRPYVGMTLFDYCYLNVRRIDSSRPPTARNLQSAIGMTGTPAERVSQAAVSAVEYAAHWCLQGIDSLYVQKLRMLDHRENHPGGDAKTREAIRQSLATIAAGILEMARCIQSLDVHRAPPAIWNIVTALWCSTRPGEAGFDGTGAPSFGLLDSFFGRREFRSELGRMTKEQLTRRIPEFQRDVLAAVQREDFPSFVRKASAHWPEEGDFGWSRCLAEYHALLRVHLRKVFAFLEVGRMITGRDTTNGGLHEQLLHREKQSSPHCPCAGALPSHFYDTFERAILERGQPADMCSKLLATSVESCPGVFCIHLTVPPHQPPLHAFPGDHIEVHLNPDHTASGSSSFRRYSLSTVSADGRSASLTVARRGVGSHFVIGEPGVPHPLKVRVSPSSFRMPADPSVPVALIAGGVGISPFIGFVEARSAIAPERRGRMIVFLSARVQALSPRYDELAQHAEAGVIELFTCYTRESTRVDIAGLLRLKRQELLTFLNDVDGHVFVCGPSGFCLSVQAAIDEIHTLQGGANTAMNARIVYECFGAPLRTHQVHEPIDLANRPAEHLHESASELPVIEWAIVRQHNHRDSAWIVIDGIIYDVTAYLRHHPGSEALLLIYAGRDASKAFNFAHSSQPSVQALLENMRIGRVPAAETHAESSAVAALRTLNSVRLLDELATREAIVENDDLAFRAWRARIVTTSWLGHIKDGILPLLRASLSSYHPGVAPETSAVALSNAETILNCVLRLARSDRFEDARQTLQAFTSPLRAWLLDAATKNTFEATSDAILKHLIEFRAGC